MSELRIISKYLKKALTSPRELRLYDLWMRILRGIYLKYQKTYNYKVKDVFFVDNRSKSKVTVLLLAGKYHFLWDITFRRMYEYSSGYDVIVVNPGGLNREKALSLVKEFGWSYFESYPALLEAAENYVIHNLVESPLVIKVDDDIFITNHTFPKLISGYKRIAECGAEIGFVAPVLNVNTISYYYFLQTLDLTEQYSHLFEDPMIFRNWKKQMIWYDGRTAEWIWEHSLPLNDISEIFAERNRDSFVPIPTRFSIGLILFEREFFEQTLGFFATFPKVKLTVKNHKASSGSNLKIPLFPDIDEASINFYSDWSHRGRFLILDAFAGHFSYFPQTEHMKKWYEKNKERLIRDIKG